MADSDKQILITPNISQTALPQIKFVGKDNAPMYQTIQDDGTIAFNGAQGEVFSIGPTMATGNVFAVSDISGIPLLEVNSNSNITIRGNITSTSQSSFNTMAQYYYQRTSMGTGTVDLRVPVGGAGTANPNIYSMPRAGKIMAFNIIYYGGAITTTSGTDVFRITKRSSGVSDVTTDISIARTSLTNINSNNHTTTVELDTPVTFAADDGIFLKRQTSGGSVTHVGAVLYMAFDA